jgi:hypothetical protein
MSRLIKMIAALSIFLTLVSNPGIAQASAYGIPIQTLTGDVTGDRQLDQITLYGTKRSPDSPYYEKLNIVVQSSPHHPVIVIPISSGGYNPYMKLCDFNGDEVEDILVGAETGGSAGISDYLLYTVKNNQPLSLPLPQPLTGEGVYKDNYMVYFKINETGKVYKMDTSHRKELYDKEGIYKNGKLLKPTSATINAFGKLEPIHAVTETQCSLIGLQRISGIYNADAIGYLVSLWKWNPHMNKWSLLFSTIEETK